MSKYLVVSIHDFSPAFQPELEEIVTNLDSRDVHPRSVLVVPDWLDGNPIADDPSFVSLLQSEYFSGSEICLHGFDHHHKEFKDISYVQANSRIVKGLESLRQLGVYPVGFVPPYWKISDAGIVAVEEEGFDFMTLNPFVVDFRNRKSFSSRPIWYWPYDRLLGFGFRQFNNFLAVWLEDNDLVRIAVHPNDVHTSDFSHALSLIDYFLERRVCTSYKDYLIRIS